MGDWLGGFKPQQRYYEAKQDNIYVAKPSIRGVDMQRAYSKNPVLVLKNHFNSIKSKIFEKDIKTIYGNELSEDRYYDLEDKIFG